MEKPYVVGIDIGAQTAKYGIVDARGNVLAQSVIVSNSQPTAEEFINDLCNGIRKLAGNEYPLDQIRGIGVGAPNGNYYTGTIENAANLTWAKNGTVEFVKMMESQLGVPVALTNDANAAAVGEMTYGAARGMKNFIIITLGTGVGSGIVINGDVVYGHDGFAGELGHTCRVRNNGRICGCGKTGCLETYASATGVARTARELLELTDRKSILRTLPAENITSKDVFDAAIEGDELAKDIFTFTGRILGEAFADFVAFSSPEAIILFGGLTKAGDLIYKPIVEAMNLNLLPIWKGKIKVLFSTLKESDAAILGAGALGWEL
ncbi:MAG: ROK family protein [bacterium]|uniref:ROK family protein n=1 Tax=Candidatus Aphodosoma intestinipullorum TaxID=2840674 RepID=A0A940IE15_9BACT|nr:ROK family protein [Candidatus Aphodosoma intestinipullorum]